MPPNDGCGGWTPRPRKESVASYITAWAALKLAMTISAPAILGSTSRRRMCSSPAPTLRAASTNSRPRNWMPMLRESRTKSGMLPMPTAIMACSSDGPVIATTAMASRMIGKLCRISVSREMIRSVRPPRPPAMVPSTVPRMPPISRTIRAASAATCAAPSKRLSRSPGEVQADGVGINYLDALDRRHLRRVLAGDLGVLDPFDGEGDVLRREVAAVVELDALAQLEGHRQAIRGGRPGFRQRGPDLQIGLHEDQAFEDHGPDGMPQHVQRRAMHVERFGIARDGDRQRAAFLAGGLRGPRSGQRCRPGGHQTGGARGRLHEAAARHELFDHPTKTFP